jgi:hypothetical protein
MATSSRMRSIWLHDTESLVLPNTREFRLANASRSGRPTGQSTGQSNVVDLSFRSSKEAPETSIVTPIITFFFRGHARLALELSSDLGPHYTDLDIAWHNVTLKSIPAVKPHDRYKENDQSSRPRRIAEQKSVGVRSKPRQFPLADFAGVVAVAAPTPC